MERKYYRPYLKIACFSILLTVCLITLYFILLSSWISLNVPSNSPSYVYKTPLRRFFLISLVFLLIISYPLTRLLREKMLLSEIVRFSGLLMTLIGGTGLIIILPQLGTLSNLGGLTPDFGHILTYENVTGVIFLFLLFSGLPLFTAAYLAISYKKQSHLRKIFPIILGLPAYFVGAFFYDIISYIVETSSLTGKFIVSSTFGLGVTTVTWLYLKHQEDQPFENNWSRYMN